MTTKTAKALYGTTKVCTGDVVPVECSALLHKRTPPSLTEKAHLRPERARDIAICSSTFQHIISERCTTVVDGLSVITASNGQNLAFRTLKAAIAQDPELEYREGLLKVAVPPMEEAGVPSGLVSKLKIVCFNLDPASIANLFFRLGLYIKEKGRQDLAYCIWHQSHLSRRLCKVSKRRSSTTCSDLGLGRGFGQCCTTSRSQQRYRYYGYDQDVAQSCACASPETQI